ncbi:hypothetical protein P5G51_008515 [Virgibacillus sp. 179-BFC.A HS]|uniref:Uncharacterized protein n=1 Tax=Tigheibacillus jepli TaxID=3035914 RepID=A0ABU5CGK8_9BACI|nr:hypothetical protein [Virgibacillus sp. 179-BFC.A HS]MDY0405435.1 hypothetical protein [Virgibacillus sp. 179-BFC.A HS]
MNDVFAASTDSGNPREAPSRRIFKKIVNHDGIPVEVPLLEISAKPSEAVKAQLLHLNAYEWIFLPVPTGLTIFMN